MKEATMSSSWKDMFGEPDVVVTLDDAIKEGQLFRLNDACVVSVGALHKFRSFIDCYGSMRELYMRFVGGDFGDGEDPLGVYKLNGTEFWGMNNGEGGITFYLPEEH
jgi:hypothetical protein